VPLSQVSIGLSSAATGPGVWIFAAGAAGALESATEVLIVAATVVFAISRRVVAASARTGSVYHWVYFILGKFVLGVFGLHVHGFHGLSSFIISCIYVSHHLKTSLSELNIKPTLLVHVSELWCR